MNFSPVWISARFVIHYSVDIYKLIAGMKRLSKGKFVTASMVEEFALDPTLQDLFTQNWKTGSLWSELLCGYSCAIYPPSQVCVNIFFFSIVLTIFNCFFSILIENILDCGVNTGWSRSDRQEFALLPVWPAPAVVRIVLKKTVKFCNILLFLCGKIYHL